MGWKCTPQIKGLVRGEPKPNSKHRANAKAFCGEAGVERHSASETLDRTRSHLNQYEGYTSGFEAHDEMLREADEYVTTYTDKNGITRNRKLKSDAVIGYAMIINPPEEVCALWTAEQYSKFYTDSWEIMKQLQPTMFRDDTVLMRTEHRDEGIGDNDYHQHIIGIPKDADGKYCGNGIDAKMLSELNKTYPKMMRDRGWDMDDLDTTDWDKYKNDSEYKIERKIKAKRSGKNVNEYINSKLTDELDKAIEATEEAQKQKKGNIKVKHVMQDMLKRTLEEKEELEKREKSIRCQKDKLEEREKEMKKYEEELLELNRQLQAQQQSIIEKGKKMDEGLREIDILGTNY